MTVKITIECDNAAFEDNEPGEIARILKDASQRIANFWDGGQHSFRLHDGNGNKVGSVEIED